MLNAQVGVLIDLRKKKQKHRCIQLFLEVIRVKCCEFTKFVNSRIPPMHICAFNAMFALYYGI